MRYYFHIHVIDGVSKLDEWGAELASEQAAIEAALRLARELSTAALSQGEDTKYSVELMDEVGRSIVRLDGHADIKVN
jgi:hypothetical protein